MPTLLRSPHRATRFALTAGLIRIPWFALLALLRSGWLLGKFGAIRARRNRIGTARASGTRHVVMLVLSELPRDPRVERAARTLAAAGYRITILCPAWSDKDEDLRLDWGPGISVTALPRRTELYRFPYLADRAMYRAAVQSGAWAFHCHDLNTCIMGLAAAAATGAACICDFHEWFSENVVWDRLTGRYVPHPAWRRQIYRAAERVVMRSASRVVTVCDSIATALIRTWPLREEVDVIRNIPVFSTGAEHHDLRAEAGVPPEAFLLLYQGGVGPSRYLEPVIDALAKAPGVWFVIRGPGIDQHGAAYRERARRLGVENRLVLLPPVPSSQVVSSAAGADAGVWTLEDICLNFRFALPNKVFEYLAAGIPLAVADYPEVRRLVERHEVGVTFKPDSPDSIAAALSRLRNDPALCQRIRSKIPDALAQNDAGREWQKLVGLYDGIANAEGLPCAA